MQTQVAETAVARQALVLFAHGARDALWAEPFQRLRDRIQRHAPNVAVALAFLELLPPSLPDLATQLDHDGITEVTITPVFFGQGGHVTRDLPRVVAALKTAYPHMRFRVAKAVGEDDGVLDAMATYCLRTL